MLFIILLIYSGCCHVFSAVLYALAETHVFVMMLQPPLRSEIARYTFQKNATHGSVIFPATVFSKYYTVTCATAATLTTILAVSSSHTDR